MTYDITPYVQVGPIEFGMTEDDVLLALGGPAKIVTSRRGELEFAYDKISVRFSKTEKTVVEIAILPGAEARIEGVRVFGPDDPLRKLIQMDGNSFEYLGFIILLDLGVALTGFHDANDSQKALTVFAKGRWNHLMPKFKRFHLSD